MASLTDYKRGITDSERGVLDKGLPPIELFPLLQPNEFTRWKEANQRLVLALLPDGRGIIAPRWVAELEKHRIGQQLAAERTSEIRENLNDFVGSLAYGAATAQGWDEYKLSNLGATYSPIALAPLPHELNKQTVVGAPANLVHGAPTYQRSLPAAKSTPTQANALPRVNAPRSDTTELQNFVALVATIKTAEEARGTAQKLSGPPKAQPQPAKAPAKSKEAPPQTGGFIKQSLDERIFDAEQDLQESRQKTARYFQEREAAGLSRKGGTKKAIDNAKEQLWILKRQKAYPNRQLLEGCKIIGVRTPSGKFKETASITSQGRDPDFIEIDGNKAELGELKSEWELQNTLRGGPGTASGGTTNVAPSSKLAGQWAAEDDVLAYARKVNGKLVISGYDVKTGLRVEGEFDPTQIGRRLFSSTEGWGSGNEWTQ